MWSMWPWVSNTATGCSRCSARISSTPSTASCPGSMTTHCSPGAVATTSQLVPNEPAGNPATSTRGLLLDPRAISALGASRHGGPSARLTAYWACTRPRLEAVAGSKRERELARQRLERQAARRTALRRRRQRRLSIAASVVAVLLVLGSITYLATRGGKSSRTTNQAAAANAAATPGGCAYPKAPKPAAKDVGVPPADGVDRTTPYVATITLSSGSVTADLATAPAPCTVNSFRYLAGRGYFDGTPCHRLTTQGIFVLQCGDPAGSGSGGPGYQFADENLTGATYPAGTLAMAATTSSPAVTLPN